MSDNKNPQSQMSSDCRENCDQEYIEAAKKAKELHSTDVNAMFDKTSLANGAEEEASQQEPMLKWFDYGHLPEKLQNVSKPFHFLAHGLCDTLKPGRERTVALRKLLESKDAAVRSAVCPGA